MKKMRKGKKLLLILLIAIAIILVVVGIVNIVKKTPEKPGTTDETPVIQLPETTYSDMEVRNIILEYLIYRNSLSIYIINEKRWREEK